MTPDELDAIEAEIVEGDESVDDLAALIAALREAWAQIERFDDVLWKKCEEKVDAEARAEKAEAAIARVRALCDGEWLWSVPITYITAAIDGGDDE